MDDLQRAIERRKSNDAEFASTFDKGYEEFKIGVMLKEARQSAGITQEALAIRLSTLYNYAEAVGKKIRVSIQ